MMRARLHQLRVCLKWGVLSLALMLLLAVLTLMFWVWQPYDAQAWRVKLPVWGHPQVRVVPLLMLATSAPGRWCLDKQAFTLQYGNVQIYDQEGLRIRCRDCWLDARSVSPYPIVVPWIELWLRMEGAQLTGSLTAGEPPQLFHITFSGKVTMRNLRLAWQLPATPLTHLLRVLAPHSAAIRKAQVTGALTAQGTLRWPKQEWSALPELGALHVSGLDISAATRTPMQYDCPLLNEQKFPEKMQWVSASKMGRWLPMATLIAEDVEFKHHPGFVMRQMQRLLGQETAAKAVGGSTITQQLAKYLFTDGERTWKRKIEELLYAVQLEQTLSKEAILMLYLNTLDWGPSLCGAHAAANYYFASTPQQLTPMQAAWLASIIRNPHRAWKTQYLKQQPDLTRAAHILSFMPPSARNQPGEIGFAPIQRQQVH